MFSTWLVLSLLVALVTQFADDLFTDASDPAVTSKGSSHHSSRIGMCAVMVLVVSSRAVSKLQAVI